MSDDRKSSIELDEILSRAVDRQIAEQRALRQTLDELRDTVRELSNKPPPKLDLTTFEDRLRTIIEVNSRSANESIRSVIETSVLGASESTFASLSEQLRSFREAVVPRLEQGGDLHALSAEIAGVRDLVGSVSGDLEGIAQALIDFNSGLRGWASGLDESVASIRLTVGELFAVATQPPATPAKEPEPVSTDGEEAPAKKPPLRKDADEAPGAMEDRIKETVELSEYLADQIEDLDGLMSRLTELPVQLEGVVSQALKRTLTARAKLDREAETALDDVLGSLDEHVNQLTDVLQRFEQEEDHIRKLALEQVELSSRVESLQSTFVDRIERAENERRRGEEALAMAFDRSARGLPPRAMESLTKASKRRKPPAPPRKQVKAKAARAKQVASKTTVRKQAKRKAKRSTPRRAKRLDWTPLPNANDDTPT